MSPESGAVRPMKLGHRLPIKFKNRSMRREEFWQQKGIKALHHHYLYEHYQQEDSAALAGESSQKNLNSGPLLRQILLVPQG